MKAIRNNIDCFFISACKGSPVPVWIEQGRALTGFRKNLPRCACGIFPESLAQSGTGQRGRQEIKNRLTSREMSNLKIKDMSRSNFTPMKRFYEIIGHYGLRLMEVGTNHLRVFSGGRKLFDYYPLRMKLFDYRQWQQLTYPSLIEGTDKWETELDEIINRLNQQDYE